MSDSGYEAGAAKIVAYLGVDIYVTNEGRFFYDLNGAHVEKSTIEGIKKAIRAGVGAVEAVAFKQWGEGLERVKVVGVRVKKRDRYGNPGQPKFLLDGHGKTANYAYERDQIFAVPSDLEGVNLQLAEIKHGMDEAYKRFDQEREYFHEARRKVIDNLRPLTVADVTGQQ